MPGKQSIRQRNSRRSRGQSLIEFALLLPILLLLVLGAMDFGRMFYSKIVITNAAREGANYISRNIDDKGKNYATTYSIIQTEASSSGIDPSMLTLYPPINCCDVGQKVGVRVELEDLNIFFSNFYEFITAGDTITLSSTVWMVVQ